ncbi:MAG TPA: hypothetical protein ENI87_10805 [bacterium]|nr:hypothetical protein [bacterium]
MTRTEVDPTTTLRELQEFCQRVLPGVLRRISQWKGIPPHRLQDWQDDLQQELYLDVLEHAEANRALGRRDRHQRWMRLVQRLVYEHTRWHQRRQPFVGEPCAGERGAERVDVTLPEFVALSNGRVNIAATARRARTARRSLREQFDRLAAQLGWDRERELFWVARAAEALTGLAADLLRQDPRLHLLEPCTRQPAPQRRVQRLRRLARRFPVHPSTRAVRSALRPWQRHRAPDHVPPRLLLEQATGLLPAWAPAWAWLFEACCLAGDLRAAARAVRRLHRLTRHPRRAALLARARLLDLRGRRAAAAALLTRAARRTRPDRRIERVLATITAHS